VRVRLINTMCTMKVNVYLYGLGHGLTGTCAIESKTVDKLTAKCVATVTFQHLPSKMTKIVHNKIRSRAAHSVCVTVKCCGAQGSNKTS
jgi:hypothetical protein